MWQTDTTGRPPKRRSAVPGFWTCLRTVTERNTRTNAGEPPPLPPPTPAAQQTRLPFLDGLRGIGILAVMLYHFTNGVDVDNEAMDGFVGVFTLFYMGVDVFFLVSGFLITRILIRAAATKKSVYAFMMRRAIRIFPPYWFYLIACLTILPAIGHYSARSYINDHWIWFITYTNNILIALEGWPASYLSHLWSLAVEEQFYLLWPLLFIVPILRRNWFLILSLCVALPSVLRVLILETNLSGYAGYVLLPTRMDPLALGAMIAFFEAKGMLVHMHRALKWLSLPALLLFALLMTGRLIEERALVPLRMNVGLRHLAAAILSGLAVTSCMMGRRRIQAMLSNGFLVKVGIVSYALYLWHFFVNAAFDNEGLHPMHFTNADVPLEWLTALYILLASAISYLIAILSWKYFEEPTLRLKKYFQWEPTKPASPAPTKPLPQERPTA